jgi:hypothetical protein
MEVTVSRNLAFSAASNQASGADIALLEECLAKFPTVEGVTLQDSSDEGN